MDRNPTYRVIMFSKHIPVSHHNNNPNYTLATEFVVYKGIAYYDLDGIVYRFKK